MLLCWQELMDLEMDTYRNNIIRVSWMWQLGTANDEHEVCRSDGLGDLQMKVFLGACHFIAGVLWAVANVFGMNLGLGEDDFVRPAFSRFVQVST